MSWRAVLWDGTAVLRLPLHLWPRIFWPPRREPRNRVRRGAVAALILGAVGVAAGTLGAAWQASAANGDWQESVRVQNRVTGHTIEITRYVYEMEAPQAFDVAALRVHAEELERQAARTPPGSALRVEAAAERSTATGLEAEYARTNGMSATNRLLADPRYRTADGGYDVVARLLDEQRDYWGPEDDPGPALADGNRAAAWARAWIVLMAASLVLSLAGMVVWVGTLRSPGVLMWRRLLFHWAPRPFRFVVSPAGDPAADRAEPAEIGLGSPAPPVTPPSVEPEPAAAPVLMAGVGLVLGILATAFTAVQIGAGVDENRGFALAANRAAEASATAAGGGVRQSFGNGSHLRIDQVRRRGEKLRAGPGADAVRRGDADVAAADRLDGILAAMAAPPGAGDGLAAPIRAVLVAPLADAFAATEAGNDDVDEANRAGKRSNTMVIALFAVTVAAILVDLAAAHPLRRRRYLGFAAASAVVALVVAVLQPIG